MSKNDENDKRLMRDILEKAGLEVEHVPESTTRTCDLRAKSGQQENYLFELKGFHDALALAPTLRRGIDYSESLAYDTARAVQSGIHKAIEQLESTARKDADELRFLALLVRSKYDAKVVFQQILGNLYGKRSLVVDSGTPGKADLLECLYFSHSAFFRYQSALDGALVVDGEGAALFLNDYTPRLQRVRDTELGRFFTVHKATHDITTLVSSGFLVADCDIDRKNEQEVLEFIKRKYNLGHPILMHFKRHSAFARVH